MGRKNDRVGWEQLMQRGGKPYKQPSAWGLVVVIKAAQGDLKDMRANLAGGLHAAYTGTPHLVPPTRSYSVHFPAPHHQHTVPVGPDPTPGASHSYVLHPTHPTNQTHPPVGPDPHRQGAGGLVGQVAHQRGALEGDGGLLTGHLAAVLDPTCAAIHHQAVDWALRAPSRGQGAGGRGQGAGAGTCLWQGGWRLVYCIDDGGAHALSSSIFCWAPVLCCASPPCKGPWTLDHTNLTACHPAHCQTLVLVVRTCNTLYCNTINPTIAHVPGPRATHGPATSPANSYSSQPDSVLVTPQNRCIYSRCSRQGCGRPAPPGAG